ncbi:MAG: hypothetical protein JSU83_00550 [Deltaproteobacteria bacterium]|nr:MAG: hypothetical protein JSU83_00550 [Deltaproteobacteria bacterium]
MVEKNTPNQTDKLTGKVKDDEILELAVEVLKTSDDEIVELRDMTDMPANEDEEEIIDLSEVADIPLEEDEEIMDLTDDLDESSAMDEELTELSDIVAESPPQDEDILDLDDFADDTVAGAEEILDLDDMLDESPMDFAEETPAVAAESDAEALELTDLDREAIAEELSLDLDTDAAEETAEIQDDTQQTADDVTDLIDEAEPLEETVELSDLDSEAPIMEADGDAAEKDESDTVELTELDSETIDKELGELNLGLEDESQAETAELTLDQETATQDPNLNLGAEMADDTVELQDTDRAPAESEVVSPEIESAPMGNLELTDSDREIIDEELSLEFDREPPTEKARLEDDSEPQEQELSLDLDAGTGEKEVDSEVTESAITDQDLTQQQFAAPPVGVAAEDEDRKEEFGFDFEKEEDLAESLGMTIDSETEPAENLMETEELEDIYKTQEILDEISQFDSVEASAMHKQTDPISIKVQDPTAENRLEIDSLEQEAVPEPGSLSSEQLELAVERVVKKMFAEKIEGILIEVIERTVTKEINRIKNILLDETSGDV